VSTRNPTPNKVVRGLLNATYINTDSNLKAMVKTQQFDLIVIGAGSGLNLIPSGWKTAVVEKGPMGGTCLNRGCIPSKIIIHSADIAEEIKNAKKFGLNAALSSVNFGSITQRASTVVDHDAKKIEHGLNSNKDITLFKGTGKFIDERTIQVGKDIIKGDKIVIAAGCRPTIPPIEGIEDVDYWTSTEALRAKKQPKTLTIVGGGYIATELGHYYGSLGTKVTIVQRNERLVPDEDEEVSRAFTESWKKKYNIFLSHTAKKVYKKGKKFYLEIEKKEGGGKKTVVSDALLLATGVRPNTDVLHVEKAGIKTDKYGFIVTNDYLETSAKNVWALGDIIGTHMLKHTANYEAEIVFENAIAGNKVKRDYKAVPHAIFSSPQIAGVGATEQQLRDKKIKYIVGKHRYIKTGMGEALQDEEGFVKVLVDPKTRKFLGCHVMGAQASSIIHEIIVAMQHDLTADDVVNTIHIHPALSEVVQRAVNNAVKQLQ
jgi:mycothione reductase